MAQPASPVDAVARLRAALSDVASVLFAVDNSGDLVFVRAQADAGNRPAKAALASLAVAWEHYPLAKEAVERVEAALSAGDHAAVAQGLGPDAVVFPGGSTAAIGTVLNDVRARTGKVAAEITRLAEGARKALLRLDGARAAVEELVVRAAALGAGDDPEVAALRPAVDTATDAIAADPTADPDLAGLDRMVDAARRRVEALEQGRSAFPADLAAAESRLVDIEAVAARGAEARARAEAKIAGPAGLLPPLDPRAGGDGALRPRLDRIRRQAEAGDWSGAAAALVAWRNEADDWLARVTAVAEANAAPVAHRNELRGLLDGYRAKAVAHGRDEDGRLARLYEAAKSALYVAPCRLDEADRLVRDYVTAVNAAARGGEA